MLVGQVWLHSMVCKSSSGGTQGACQHSLRTGSIIVLDAPCEQRVCFCTMRPLHARACLIKLMQCPGDIYRLPSAATVELGASPWGTVPISWCIFPHANDVIGEGCSQGQL